MNLLSINQAISPPLVKSKAFTSSDQISSIKMKPIFRRKVTFRCSIPSHPAYIAKYRPKMLSTIELSNLQSNQPDFKTIRIVCQALKDAKRTPSLIIKRDESISQNLKQLKHLFNNIPVHLKKLTVPYISSEHPLFPRAITRVRKSRDLSNLEVYLYCSNKEMKNRILSHLLQQLKGLKSLETFNLDLSRCGRWEGFTEGYEPNAPIFKTRFPRSLKSLSLNLEKTDFPHREMLSAFATNLSQCNSLTYLNLHWGLNHTGPLDIKILAPIFERVKSLKSFKMNPIFPPRLQFQDSLNLVKNFEFLKPLTELNLFIYFCLQEGSSILFAKDLYRYIASLTNLRCLTLHLCVEKFFDDLNEQSIFLPLQSLINLKTLRFSLQCDEDKELPGLQSLSQALRSLACLEEFVLCFIQNKVSRSQIISISDMLKNLVSLRSLSLMFHDSDLESDSLDLLSKGISHLKLSSFSFNPRDKASNLQQNKAQILKHQKGLTSLFSTLSNLTSLHSLDLNLSVFDLLTKELRSLSLALKEKQFSYLYLELPQLPPDRNFQGLRSLMSSIREMSNLSSLELVFRGDKLCDEEVEFVVSNITEYNKSLQTLKLKFSETTQLKNRSLIALKSRLGNLALLKNLVLFFGPNKAFYEEIVYGLFEALSYQKSLETFAINLPSEAVPLDINDILRKFAGHWNLRAFIVNHTSWLRSAEH